MMAKLHKPILKKAQREGIIARLHDAVSRRSKEVQKNLTWQLYSPVANKKRQKKIVRLLAKCALSPDELSDIEKVLIRVLGRQALETAK